jgi:hypothetical protein
MDNRVHALSHEMKSKSTRTKLTRGQALERVGLRFRAPVNENYFQPRFCRIGAIELVELNLYWAFEFATVGVANHICDGFIQSEGDFVAVLFPKPDSASKRRHGASNATKHHGITQELKPQKKLPPWQVKILRARDCNGNQRLAANRAAGS